MTVCFEKVCAWYLKTNLLKLSVIFSLSETIIQSTSEVDDAEKRAIYGV